MNRNHIRLFMSEMGPGARFFFYFFIIVIAFSCYQAANTAVFINKADVAEGQIVSFDEWGYFFLANGGEIGGFRFPIVKYKTQTGDFSKMFRVMNFGKADLGKPVKVYYDHDDPLVAKLDTYSDLWKTTTLIFGFGFLGLFLVYFWWVKFDAPII